MEVQIFALIAVKEWRVNRMNKEVIIDIENPKDNDLISREAVKGMLCAFTSSIDIKTFERIWERIKQLPSVNVPDCQKCDNYSPCMYCEHEFKECKTSDLLCDTCKYALTYGCSCPVYCDDNYSGYEPKVKNMRKQYE